MPPRQYLALVRQQDLDWHEARLVIDGFDQDAFLWRQQRLGELCGTWNVARSSSEAIGRRRLSATKSQTLFANAKPDFAYRPRVGHMGR